MKRVALKLDWMMKECQTFHMKKHASLLNRCSSILNSCHFFNEFKAELGSRLFRRRNSKSSALSDGQKRPSVLDGHPACVQSQPSMWQTSLRRLRKGWNNL
uniref:Uncharacterized protein n=1 Tax=Populus davidiana TaxID=266767 RepID=A0A6M2EK91_9ROSI